MNIEIFAVIVLISVFFLWMGQKKGVVFTIGAAFILLLSGIFIIVNNDVINVQSGANVTTSYTYSNSTLVSTNDNISYYYQPINTKVNTMISWVLLLGGLSTFIYSFFEGKKQFEG
jgi:hypothetical protein